MAANWDNADGFWEHASAFVVGAGAGAATGGAAGAGFWATAGVAAGGSAVTASTNNVLEQTGRNFSGMGSVDWGQVGKDAAIGGVSGFAGSAAGTWAANADFLVNGINSPLLRSAVVSPIAAAVGHISGGTAYGVLSGQSIDRAFLNSFEGIDNSMAIGTGVGVASTAGVSYANGVNPFNGRRIIKQNDLNCKYLIKNSMICC